MSEVPLYTPALPAVERIRNMQDSHGQNLALAFQFKSSKYFKFSPLRSEAVLTLAVGRAESGLDGHQAEGSNTSTLDVLSPLP